MDCNDTFVYINQVTYEYADEVSNCIICIDDPLFPQTLKEILEYNKINFDTHVYYNLHYNSYNIYNGLKPLDINGRCAVFDDMSSEEALDIWGFLEQAHKLTPSFNMDEAIRGNILSNVKYYIHMIV